MAIKTNRMIALLKLLMNADDIMSAENIAQQLFISDRTLRDDITKFKQVFLEHGIEIVSKHGAGYRTIVHNEEAYYAFIETLLKEESHNQRLLPVYPEDRINYLIKLFLTSDTYIKIDDVADEIFVSRSTLSNDLKEVRERLLYFHLELESKPAYGSRIIGNEFHRRSCIAQYFFHTETCDDIFMSKAKMNENQMKIRDLLYETMQEADFKLTDIGFQNLIIHISIALIRINDQKPESDLSSYAELKDKKEYYIAQQLAKAIEDSFQVELPELEIFYITIHLLGKKTMQYSNSFIISEEVEQLLQEIFKEINLSYSIDLSSDFELYTLLALHFQPMMNRLQYGLSIQNPLLEQIKKENSIAFEIAILAANVIHKYHDVTIDEAEIGYLALHFALAIERIHEQVTKKNIIIVCASGAGSSQILLYKVKQRFKEYLQEVKVTELYELERIDQSKYDFILSTVPIPFATNIPVLQVQYFLDGKDVANVSDAFVEAAQSMDFIDQYFHNELFFTNLDVKTKEEAIHALCARTAIIKALPYDFEASVLKREDYAATEFGNLIAIPHTMEPMCEETFVSVAILSKPIRWLRQSVKYVFLLCVKKETSEALGLFHESLTSLVMDRSAMMQLEKEPTIANLKAILRSIAICEEHDDIFK